MAVAVVDVQVNGQNAVRDLRQINAASKAATAGVDGLKAAATRLIGVFAGVSALKFVFAKTSELESQTRSLETLTGSADKARQIISELQRIGAVTPFTSTELIDAAKRLQAFGVEADKVVETTRRLADVSGATGAELQGLVNAYGQVQAKGRLQGEELLQFQERGVALQEELRKMYGLTGDEFQKALSKGRVSAEAVEVALVRLTETGGKYANGAVAQSSTLAGKFSTLVDGVENVAKKIGEVLKPALKEILDIAINVVNKINEALAGPDYKKANDRLYNTRAAIKRLTADIKAAEKAGIGMAQGLEIKGVDGQVLAPSVPVLPRMKADLKDLQNQAKALEQRLKDLRSAAAAPKDKPSAATEPPPLLADETKQKAKSVNDLLGGQIQRTLELKKAQLETLTATKMNVAALAENSTQAQRMVEFASKYQGIQLEINALEETITKRNAIRSELLALATDRQSTALAFDEQTRDLQNAIATKRQEINTLAAEHIGQVNQLAIAEAQKLESITAETQYLQDVIRYGEEEAAIREQIQTILKDTSTLDNQAVEDAVRKNSALTQQIDAAQQMKQVYQDIGSVIKSGVVDSITSAINGTKTLADVANNLLSNIANRLIDVAINMALFGAFSGTGTGGGLLGGLFKKRAMGGSVTGGQSYLVGERGPELFTPGRSGGIAPNGSIGGSNIVVNVDATGSSVQGNGSQGRQLGAAIAAAVQAELVKQKRPGGLLA